MGIRDEGRWFESEVQRRGITQICHFTRLGHLQSIKTHGLRSSRFLKSRNLPFYQNDSGRWDGLENHICCSIQYPNGKLLEKWRRETESDEWLILFISPNIICGRTAASVKYSATNAAWKRGSLTELGKGGFQKMFEQTVETRWGPVNRSSNLPKFCTTDLQAEVLLNKPVPWEGITTVVAMNERVVQEIKQIDSGKRVLCDQRFFTESGINSLRNHPDL